MPGSCLAVPEAQPTRARDGSRNRSRLVCEARCEAREPDPAPPGCTGSPAGTSQSTRLPWDPPDPV